MQERIQELMQKGEIRLDSGLVLPKQVAGLFEAVGWKEEASWPAEVIESAFNIHALARVTALTKDNRLVGMCRANGDGGYYVSLWNFVVHPDYQGKGLGKLLFGRLLKEVRQKIPGPELTLWGYPTEEMIPFYKSFGLIPPPKLGLVSNKLNP